jgi:hypothetical protein
LGHADLDFSTSFSTSEQPRRFAAPGQGNDSYVLEAGARGIAATIVDTGGHPRDSISVARYRRSATVRRGPRHLAASRRLDGLARGQLRERLIDRLK